MKGWTYFSRVDLVHVSDSAYKVHYCLSATLFTFRHDRAVGFVFLHFRHSGNDGLVETDGCGL